MDFIAATNLRYLPAEHEKGVSLALAKNACSALSHFLPSRVEGGIFPCDAGKVTSLGPLGVSNALEGLKVAPKLFCQHIRASIVHEAVASTASAYDALSSSPVEKVLSPLHRPYAPLRNSFLRAFPATPLGSGASSSSSSALPMG